MTQTLRENIATRAEFRCEYCLLPEAFATTPHQIDHIIPKQHGGEDSSDNLAFSCAICNRFKGPNLATFDPETKELTVFFHPRADVWTEHFEVKDGHITGLTPKGRATVLIFKFNDEVRIAQRRSLIQKGRYSET